MCTFGRSFTGKGPLFERALRASRDRECKSSKAASNVLSTSTRDRDHFGRALLTRAFAGNTIGPKVHLTPGPSAPAVDASSTALVKPGRESLRIGASDCIAHPERQA